MVGGMLRVLTPSGSQPRRHGICAGKGALAGIMLKHLMHQFWQRAPRRLRTTRAGRILILIALAAGLAALNTGNNLLFFGWGMVLSAIVVSGILSEATLRYLRGTACPQAPMRAGQTGFILAQLHNGSARMPAFGLDALAHIQSPQGVQQGRAPYVLRLGPKAQLRLQVPFTPAVRGAYDVVGWEVTTAYPFGFFEKSRRIDGATLRFWSAPRAVSVGPLVQKLVTHWGELAAHKPGQGEDYFALRPFRQGDDWRRINWRRSARTGRFVVVEHEAMAGRQVLLELRLDVQAAPELREHAICTLASLAEALLAQGLGVGIYTAALALVPEHGPRQTQAILAALARLNPAAPMPQPLPWQRACVSVALVGPGALPPPAPSKSVALQMGPVAA
ncbi:hypothetical protein Q3G72_026900 [Acer saccharum]|nr:hypothetical protein Q3G72_026900 [Acer saccharum]